MDTENFKNRSKEVRPFLVNGRHWWEENIGNTRGLLPERWKGLRLNYMEQNQRKQNLALKLTLQKKLNKKNLLFFISMWIQIVHDVGVVSSCVDIVFNNTYKKHQLHLLHPHLTWPSGKMVQPILFCLTWRDRVHKLSVYTYRWTCMQ